MHFCILNPLRVFQACQLIGCTCGGWCRAFTTCHTHVCPFLSNVRYDNWLASEAYRIVIFSHFVLDYIMKYLLVNSYICYRKRLWNIWKAQWKHSYLTSWFARNGLAQATVFVVLRYYHEISIDIYLHRFISLPINCIWINNACFRGFFFFFYFLMIQKHNGQLWQSYEIKKASTLSNVQICAESSGYT